jgi:hypothetical protein
MPDPPRGDNEPVRNRDARAEELPAPQAIEQAAGQMFAAFDMPGIARYDRGRCRLSRPASKPACCGPSSPAVSQTVPCRPPPTTATQCPPPHERAERPDLNGQRYGPAPGRYPSNSAGRRAFIWPGLLRRQRSLPPGFPRQDSDRLLDVYAVHRVPGTLSPA